MTDLNRTPAGVPTGGQFAASAKGESGVALGVDTATAKGFSILADASADALNAAFPGGRATVHDGDALSFEDAHGHSYTIRFRRLARAARVNVSPDDDHGYPSTSQRQSDLDKELGHHDVVAAVGEALEAAHKRRAFREYLEANVAAVGDGRGQEHWSVANDHAYVFGVCESNEYVNFGAYHFSPGKKRPSAVDWASRDEVTFSLGEHDNAAEDSHDPAEQRFNARRTETGVVYFADEKRLAPWQVTALEAELARRGAPSPAALLIYAAHVGKQRFETDTTGH